MISVRINGETREFDQPLTVREILSDLAIKEGTVAIAVNESVVPKAEWDKILIQDGDRVEIIRVVAGGLRS